MKLNLKHVRIRSTDALDSWVEKQILALGETRQIDEANIELAYHADASPGYEARVHLVTPGPDVFAESREHTIRAAFEKAMKQLRTTITHRAAKKVQNVKTNLQAPVSKSRGARR
jgi:ribosome-associated translation inhibitor RaiA